MINVEVYVEYCGGGVSAVGYSNNKRLFPSGTEHPPVLMISLHMHHDNPHGTQDIPPVLKTPHGTEHTLYRVPIRAQQISLR